MLKYVFICKNMNFRGLLISNDNEQGPDLYPLIGFIGPDDIN